MQMLNLSPTSCLHIFDMTLEIQLVVYSNPRIFGSLLSLNTKFLKVKFSSSESFRDTEKDISSHQVSDNLHRKPLYLH